MAFSISLLERLDTLDSDLKGVLWSFLEEIERNREESVNRSDFHELTGIVNQLGHATRELAEAQNKTEIRIEQLAEAQNKTEIRLEQLAEAQKKTEIRLDRLTEKVEQLAEAQNKTEIRLDRLTEKVEQLAEKVGQLAEAQRKTENEICKLTKSHNDLQKQVGGLTGTVGYTLENASYKALPELLLRDFGLTVQGRLKRDYVKDMDYNEIEVNILGKATTQDNREVMIIGESKSQLSINHTNEFIRKKLKPIQGVFKEIFPLMITHMISSPKVKAYLDEKKIALYYSYDF